MASQSETPTTAAASNETTSAPTSSSQTSTNTPLEKDIKEGTNDAMKVDTEDPEQKKMQEDLKSNAWKSLPPSEMLETMTKLLHQNRSLTEENTQLGTVKKEMEEKKKEERQQITDKMLDNISKAIKNVESTKGPEAAATFAASVEQANLDFIHSNPDTKSLIGQQSMVEALLVHGEGGWAEVATLRRKVEEQDDLLKQTRDLKEWKQGFERASAPSGPTRFDGLSTDRYTPYKTTSSTSSNSEQEQQAKEIPFEQKMIDKLF